MKWLRIVFVLVAVFSLTADTSAEFSRPQTVAYVDLNRYAGTWYEIARFPFKQQESCHNTTATYELNSDDTIKVTNRCRKGGFDKPLSAAFAKARVVDPVGHAKLKVKFFVLAPWADYWIIRLGSGYEYAVVSQPDRKYLWILSRTPVMEPKLYEDLVKDLAADGFDADRLEKTPQSWADFSQPSSTQSLALVSPYFRGLLGALVAMSLLWVLSLFLHDASIVDRFWGLGFVLLSFYSLTENRFLTFRPVLMVGLVTLWGVRLSLYIHFRNRGQGEDQRYQKIRARFGKSYWWKSLFIVFFFQGALLWLVSAPLTVVHLFPQPDIWTFLDFVGLAIWGTGFFLESIADYQMSQFKKRPENRGKVCRTGLWGYSRHPNYFGECLIWWGFWLIAANVDWGWATFFSPLLITYLLLRVSGVTLLEAQLSATKPGYSDYIKEVPAFIPRRLRS